MYKLQQHRISSYIVYHSKYINDNTMCKYLLPRNFYVRNLNNSVSSNDLLSNRMHIRKVLTNDIPDVLNIFQQNFSKCEPLIKGLQFPDNHYSPALKELWRNSIQQGMSYIAVPNNLIKTENSLGVVVNTKILPWEPDDWWKFASCIKCPKTRDFVTLYGFLVKDSDMHKRYNTDAIFNIAHVVENQNKCTEYKENPMKVSLALVGNSLAIGEILGFEYGTLMCASNQLSEIAKNLYMDLIYEYPCNKLVNDRLEPILYKPEPNSFVRVYIKKLNKKPKQIIDPH